MSQRLNSAISSQSTGSGRFGHTSGIDQATKPLPQMPRGWSRVRHETGLFLRSIGLGIIVTAFQGFLTNNFSEPEKVAIRQSRLTALLRLLIHALPLALAIFEIVLNWKGRYAGGIFNKQNYFQFVAKAHEILMQASLATIILSFVRYHVTAGTGMPFGAMLGALQFLQVSYLWSVELWSSIMSKEFQLQKKMAFAILVLLCITVAATAGPSSANLLIARQGIWPMDSAYLSLNATFQDIWPDRLDDRHVSSDCNIVSLTSTETLHPCPISSLYTFLESTMVASSRRNRLLIDKTNIDKFQEILLETPETDYAWGLMMAPCFGTSKNEFCSSAPQTKTLSGLYADSVALQNKGISGNALESYSMIEDDYYQPYTVVSCVTDSIRHDSDQAPLQFARIPETNDVNKDREILSVPALTKGKTIAQIPGQSSQFRVGWIDLPQEIFNTGVPGAIVVHPHSSNDSSYNITTCTMNAGWGSSTLMIDSMTIAIIRSRISHTPPSWPIHSGVLDAFGYITVNRPSFGKISNFSYPQRRVDISKTWMELINPTFVLNDNSTINAVSTMLLQLPSDPTETRVAWLMGMLFASALASTGIGYDDKVFEKRENALASCKDCLVLEIKNSVYGWTYSARETTTKLAIAVMLTYCVLVLTHIFYSAISGVSSTAWNSIAELVALAMNSSPTEVLQNTCAGIIGRKAYQTQVRVLKTSEKHLELVFGEAKHLNANVTEVAMNEKYGGIAGWNDDEYESLDLAEQGEMRRRDLG